MSTRKTKTQDTTPNSQLNIELPIVNYFFVSASVLTYKWVPPTNSLGRQALLGFGRLLFAL